MTRVLAALSVALLAGCAQIGPLPDAATVGVPPRFAFAPATMPNVPVAALLPDADPAMTLLREAALTAPDLEAAMGRIDAARAAVRASGAARLPEVSASGSVQRNRSSRATQPGNPFFVQNQTSFQAGIDASWDADIFGRLRANQRAARARLDAAGADADAVRLALLADIATALTDYRDAQARAAIVERDLADANELLRLTRIRARAGIVAGFDAVRADSLVKDAQARLAPFAGSQAAALGRLVTLSALDPVTVQQALAGTPSIALPPALATGIPSTLVANRPDVRAAALRLAATNQDVAAAAAARFPRLTLTGTLGLVALAFGDLFDGDALTASVGGSIAGPLLDFGRIGAEIDRQQGLAREAFANYRGSVFRAIGETEGALGQYAAARTRLAALEAQATVDADALSLARERYRLGLADFLTVIDAQRTVNATRQNAEGARSALRQQAIVLYRALGGEPRPAPATASDG